MGAAGSRPFPPKSTFQGKVALPDHCLCSNPHKCLISFGCYPELRLVLGITGELRKSLASTNLIESLFSVVREKIHRVKNWQGRRSNQILRWVASAIRAHRQKMRRVRGMTQAADLIAALGPRSLAARAA